MLTINVPNMTPDAVKCNLTPTSLDLDATVQGDASKGIEGKKYAFHLDFYENIVPAESKQHLTAKHLYVVLRKETAQDEYWPRLTKEKVRLHNVKTDFEKWVDEDEQDGADEGGDQFGMPEGMDMNAMLSQMGGGAGLGGLGGAGLGGAGGMDFGAMDEDGDDDEGDEKDAPAAQDGPSISEVQ